MTTLMKSSSGFTLLEMVMSLLLILLIAGVVYPLLRSSTSLLAQHRTMEEVVQNNRIALRQLVREARYAKTIYQSGANTFEMGSLYFVNADATEEKFKYQLSGGVLTKAVDMGSGYGAAYTVADHVYSFSSTYDASIQTVTFALTTNWNNKSYTGQSLAKLRTP